MLEPDGLKFSYQDLPMFKKLEDCDACGNFRGKDVTFVKCKPDEYVRVIPSMPASYVKGFKNGDMVVTRCYYNKNRQER